MSLITGNLTKVRNFSKFTRHFTAGKIIYNKKTESSKTIPDDVPGLSTTVVNVPNQPVGPGASKASDYKNPEYYCYTRTSYFDAEIEMLQYRCPQPSVHSYYEQKGAK